MKKKLVLLTVCVVAALSFAGCKKEEEIPEYVTTIGAEMEAELSSGQFYLDGDLYKFPITVGELRENGYYMGLNYVSSDGTLPTLTNKNIYTKIKDATLTTDIIVGFPGESEKEYAETREFLINNRFLMAHIFPYSPRAGTPAANMADQIPQEEKRRRAAELAALQQEITREILLEQIEKKPIQNVLFETYSDGVATGHTDSFIEVSVASETDIRGEERLVRLLKPQKTGIIGEILKK